MVSCKTMLLLSITIYVSYKTKKVIYKTYLLLNKTITVSYKT
jgi:hypothetical protein